ncbi:MAG: phosphate ABC transporter ATP-binding protein [Carbonactinosporaceae bacterium]
MGKTIVVGGLTASFGPAPAIAAVSLTAEPGSVTAVIGPAGCGRSTFLRTINRLHETAPGARVTGRVFLDGVNLYGPRADPVEVRRTVGMIFPRPNPFPSMSVYGNVVSGLRLHGTRKRAKRDEAVERALQEANLWNELKDRLGEPAARLSAGQQQRLCLARAVAVEPDALLMDEPCAALDPVSTLAIEDLLPDLKERYTIIIATHTMHQAARVADRTAFFNVSGPGQPGRLVEVGDTSTIFTHPCERATADYVCGRFG